MKGSSQKGQWLQELQEATAATGHQQGVSRRPGGQRQQSSTTTNHGPRGPMFEDTAGQVPVLEIEVLGMLVFFSFVPADGEGGPTKEGRDRGGRRSGP